MLPAIVFGHAAAVGLAQELDGIAAIAHSLAGAGERVIGVLPAEPRPGVRAYLCAFGDDDGAESWAVLDAVGETVCELQAIRDVVSIAAMCELAEETAAAGDLDDLRSQLVALRLTENPEGIDDAESAVLELQRALGTPPQLATTARLDEIASAARQLEVALDGPLDGSRFAEAMKGAPAIVDQLVLAVAGSYRGELR